MKIVFINLDRAVERRRLMEIQAKRLGLTFQRQTAMEADGIDPAEAEFLRDGWERPLTKPELACFLSHRQVWERAARSGRGLVVLEDDAILSPRFGAFVRSEPPPFDLVNLEYFDRRKFFDRRGAVEAPFGTFMPVARDKAGAAAYWLSPRGAGKLLAAAARGAAPADAFLFRSGRLDIAQLEPAIVVQAHILAALGVDPKIRTVTQIHEARRRLPLRPATLGFHGRRLAAQLSLLRFHLRRTGRLELRKPLLDLTEFERAFLDGADER